jgi:hypothetical protein
MKPLYSFHRVSILLFWIFFRATPFCSQTLNYTETNASIAYTYNPAPTIMGALPPGIDDGITPPIAIGFNFQFGCTAYTQFIASSNGWMTFNMGCISSDPNNQLAGNATQTANSERPIIAPLWDDLDVDATGNVNYQMFGATPNQTLVIEWKKMRWKVSAIGAVITFQARLMETTNKIEFWYKQEVAAVSPSATASFGLAGPTNGDYYSLTNSTAAPGVAHNAGEVTTIATKPATNQVYQWAPVCALPIKLLSFTAENAGNNTILKWSTATEENNDFFTVQRSTDAYNFTEIKTLKGAGNSYAQKNYECKDDDRNKGTVYYRLKQTDYNKADSYSGIVAVYENDIVHGISVWPNPSQNKIHVEGDVNGDYFITTISGELLQKGQVENSEIPVSDLPPGLYILKINETTKKIAIQP